MSPALVLVLAAGICPAPAPAPGGRGFSAVAKVAPEAAMRENAEGKKLYRQQRWAEARGRYQAALAEDPDFLSARLNLACAFSREGRYAEAAQQASKLIRTAYVPWQREVREAMDLGILQNQPEYAKVNAAMAESAKEWGALVEKSALFVARTRPAVNVSGQGVLLLSLSQEIFAWHPETGRYLQVTAEDGHVLGFVRSADKRRIGYVTGGKLIRNPGQPDVLRGLALRVLELPTMALGPSIPIPAEVTKVELGFVASLELLVSGPDGKDAAFRVGDAGLEKISGLRRAANLDSLVLTTAGVRPGSTSSRRTSCRFYLTSKRSSAGTWELEARSPGKRSFSLNARYGAGWPGLPFPDGSPPQSGNSP